ncbi:hypothetical protein RJ999_06140 [Aliarcobacter butzleri]|uniref:hypothetical protein n=1 Tax=Aliarcobacter butzleri TaxID=28197 RepID=UPI002874EAA4|nr:hypothetical protein [Aliarcobacter butzleri]MDS1370678.1 hypothetical protein [Aliarcobacter butzleri]
MFKEVIKKHRETISHKLDIDINKVYEAMSLLQECLKPKYANKFYFSEKEITTFMIINNDLIVQGLRADHFHFFGDDMVTLFGVRVYYKKNGYEYKYFNIVDEIPIVFKTQADNNIYNLKKMINDINSDIKIELEKILNKDDRYIDCINKEIVALNATNKFKDTFNENLFNSDIVKRTSKKIKEFYNHVPLKIFARDIKTGFSTVEVEILANIEPFVYDRCLDIEFKKETIILGELIFSNNEKHKFIPAFKNQKYFTNEVTSLNYMKNTFKKHLINTLGVNNG